MNEIKVGSEWVDTRFNTKFKVDYVGKSMAFITMEDKEEYSVPLYEFNSSYKPAPVRCTVWLNVYKDDVFTHFTKMNADKMKRPDILYQQEVELIDPREGGTKV